MYKEHDTIRTNGGSRTEETTVARDVVDRLTATLDVPFTLTDDLGAVLASTSNARRGQVIPAAMEVLRDGEQAPGRHAPDTGGPEQPHASTDAHTGLLATGPVVCLPVHASGRARGVLMAHGPFEEVQTAARTAAAAAGLAFELARGASLSARQGIGSDVALYQLLRGSSEDAARAALVARVVGWDLSVPRIAIVVLAPGDPEAAPPGPDHYVMITELIDAVAPGTPVGQLHPGEWVILPEVSALAGLPPPRRLAEDIHEALRDAGATAVLGLGQAHARDSVPALRGSYGEAAFAARCGERLHGTSAVYQLSDLGAAAFLAPDRSSGCDLAERLLRPLRAQPEVLETLEAFLDSDLSVTDTARRTGLHRHTVRNHVERVRELTGRDARSLDGALQLSLALLLSGPAARFSPE